MKILRKGIAIFNVSQNMVWGFFLLTVAAIGLYNYHHERSLRVETLNVDSTIVRLTAEIQALQDELKSLVESPAHAKDTVRISSLNNTIFFKGGQRSVFEIYDGSKITVKKGS